MKSEIELRFFSEDEREREICRRYWQVGEGGHFIETVASIASDFDMPSRLVASRVAAACLAADPQDLCSGGCKTPCFFTSRASYLQRHRYGKRPGWICEVCREAEQVEKQNKAEEEVAAWREILRRDFEAKRLQEISPEELSFAEAVYLVSLLRGGGSEDLSSIAPVESFAHPLAPTEELTYDILRQLLAGGLICAHPESRRESFVRDEKGSFYLEKVHWVMPLPEEGMSPARYLEELELRLKSEPWPEDWQIEAPELHRLVALHDCLQYLRWMMEMHRFTLKIGEKTEMVLKFALVNFSIGQVRSFIGRSVKDAAASCLQGVAPYRAANTVQGSIQRLAERALANKWEVNPYLGYRDVPQSCLSQFLFVSVLGLPDNGLTVVPPSE